MRFYAARCIKKHLKDIKHYLKVTSWKESWNKFLPVTFIFDPSLLENTQVFQWFMQCLPTDADSTLSPIVDADDEWRMTSPGGSQW